MDKLAQAGTSNDEFNNQASTAQGDLEESELAVRIRAALTVHTLTTLTHTQNTFTTPKDKLAQAGTSNDEFKNQQTTAQGDHLEESERVVRMRAALTHITAALTQAESRETDLNIANTKVKTLEATNQQLKDSLQAVSQGRKTTEVYKLTTLHCTHTSHTYSHSEHITYMLLHCIRRSRRRRHLVVRVRVYCTFICLHS